MLTQKFSYCTISNRVKVSVTPIFASEFPNSIQIQIAILRAQLQKGSFLFMVFVSYKHWLCLEWPGEEEILSLDMPISLERKREKAQPNDDTMVTWHVVSSHVLFKAKYKIQKSEMVKCLFGRDTDIWGLYYIQSVTKYIFFLSRNHLTDFWTIYKATGRC